jgi:hypothetical protein
MQQIHKQLIPLALAAGVAVAGTVQATPVGYTTPAAFAAAAAGLGLSTEGFDDNTAGTSIGSGTGLDGIAYTYDFGGDTLHVSTGYDTTSPANYLGTDPTGLIFSDETQFDLSFGPVNAIGLYFITVDSVDDGDLRLSVGGFGIDLLIANLVSTLPDNLSKVYFLGMVDRAATFSLASISTAAGSTFAYNIDDIRRGSPAPAPLPGTALLIAAGLLAAARRRA